LLILIAAGCKPSRVRTFFHSEGTAQPLIIEANSEGGATAATGKQFRTSPVTIGGSFSKNIATGTHFMVKGGALNGR
jgi:hypothetical protein